MKKTAFFIIYLSALLFLTSCVKEQKYSNIIKLLDNKQYEEAIGEIGKMKEEGYTEEDYESLKMQADVGRSASITYNTAYVPSNGSIAGKSYTLDRGYHFDVDYCSLSVSFWNQSPVKFTIEKYNELMALILKGNPKIFKGSVDSEGRYGTEAAKMISLNSINYESDHIYITVSNFDEIEDFFIKLEKAATSK